MKLGIKIGNYVAYLKICLDYCKFLNIKKYLFLPRSNCKTGQEGIILYGLAIPQILFYNIVLPVNCNLLTYKTLDLGWGHLSIHDHLVSLGRKRWLSNNTCSWIGLYFIKKQIKFATKNVLVTNSQTCCKLNYQKISIFPVDHNELGRKGYF